MARPKEEKLDYIRNIFGCIMTYLRAGNDKTLLEESLMMHIDYVKKEMERLGLTDISLPSLPESKPKGKS